MDDDLGRYEDAAGWDPTDKYKKERDRIHAQQAKQDAEDAAIASLLTVRPVAEWMSLARRQAVPKELFGPLWREGEAAVLLGDHGAGKSILAVQLAEEIARGRNTTGRECARLSEPGAVATGVLKLPTANRRLPTGRRVLLIDFQRTETQWTERYSVPSPIPGKLPVRHRFPRKNFDRAGIDHGQRQS